MLMLSLLAPVAGQQPAPKPGARPAAQDDVERVTINLVQIDVVVTDKDGRQVTDLRPEEIEILENGKRQPITNFSYISAVSAPVSGVGAATGAAPSVPAKNASTPVMPARLPRERVRRTMALVVDDLGLSFESIGFVQKALKKFVDEQMQPGDLVAILRTSSSVGALQQFTTDKRLLYAAIERVRWYPQGRGGLSPTTTLNEESAGSDFRDTVQFNREMEEARAGIYSVGTFGTVSDIVKGLGEMPGRKSLVFISEAFRLFSAQGRNVQLVTAMRRLTDDANAASVSIYTMDASGLQTDAFQASDKEGARAYVIDPQVFAMTGGANNAVAPNAPPRTLQRADTLSAQAEQDSVNAFRRLNALMDQRRDARIESQTVLSYLASNTGGLFMKNRNDLGAAMQRIMDDQKGYYLIGYRPDASAVKAATERPLMRNLSVKVKRPGLTWRTRSGYFGFTEEERRRKPRTREEQLAAALVSPFASGDVRLRLTSLFGTEPESGATYLRSLLHIDARDLLFKDAAGGGRVADVEMIAVAFGNNGQAVDQLSYPQTVRVNSDEEYQRLLQSGLVYVLNFPMKQAGAYQMRVAVRDSASERTGAAMQFVEVPDLDKKHLALSGIVLSGLNPASPGNIAAPSKSGAETAADVQTGAAVRRLRQGLLLDYRYNIYNAQLDAAGRPQLQTQMRLFRAGQTAFTGKLLPFDPGQQRDMKRLNAIGRLRIGPELTPGEYALQITVTDNLASPARRTATQWIDFEIVN
jgi:VWFA-related protein